MSASETRGNTPTILYVMGSGRSGSTLLGVILENCAGVFYAGELDAWLRNCGKPYHVNPSRAALWQEVEQLLTRHRHLCGDACLRWLEHSTALCRLSYFRRARLLRGAYREFNRDLYSAVSTTVGSSVIVDTSHYPLRARELRAITGLDLRVVLLVRDASSVVGSFRRTPETETKRLLAANAYLWLTHCLSVLVFLSHPRSKRLLIRYEDLVRNPVAAATRILRMAGSHEVYSLPKDLRTGRPLAGNRLLRAPFIRIDETPRNDAPRRLTVTSVIQLPWTVAFRFLSPAFPRR